MTDHLIRLFDSAEAIRRVGEGLIDRTLPREDWTHEAHLAACTWLLLERPEIPLERELPGTIKAYNLAVGGVNDDTQGYHETLTQLYIRGVSGFLANHPGNGLLTAVNALLSSDVGARDWPLRYYSKGLLFSVAARRSWVEPDLAAI